MVDQREQRRPRSSPSDPLALSRRPARGTPASQAEDGDTTRVERPSFSSFEPPARFPFDELFDAVETGTTSGNSLWLSLTGFARLRHVATAKKAWDRALPLGRFVRVPVRLFGWIAPAALPLTVIAGGSLGLGLLAGGWLLARAPAAPVASASAVAIVAATASAEELGTAARAALGDPAAIAAAERLPVGERNAEMVLAAPAGRLVRQRQALAELGEKLRERPEQALEPAVLTELDVALDDPRLAADALAALAGLTSAVGPDLLHEASQDPARSPAVRALAEALLDAVDLAPRASRALRAVMAVERANGCRAVALALEDAELYADERALPALQRLTAARPCGDAETEDCAACRGAVSDVPGLTAALRERASPVRLASSSLAPAPAPLPSARPLPRRPVASVGAVGPRRAPASPGPKPTAPAGSAPGVAAPSEPEPKASVTDPGF